jgi:putative spermidine/putrescine transport system substrate-binding protein
MLNRRSLLLLSGSLALSQLLTGCNADNSSFKIRLLRGSIPPQILKEFQRTIAQSDRIHFSSSDQLKDLFTLLETWNPQTAPPQPGFSIPLISPKQEPVNDLATLGDAWLPTAIQQQLIQPFPDNFALDWSKLPAQWERFGQRNQTGAIDPSGKIWAVPYRLGFLAIAYNPKKLKALNVSLNSWADLWNPALKGLISLPDSARVVIGLALQKLNQSVNLENLATVPTLAAELKALHAQVKLYDSEAYLQPLILEDTAIAVGWSSEILPTMRRNPAIAALIPASGSLLTADLWVRPVTAPALKPETTKLLLDWLQFCWQPKIAAQLALLSRGASPALSSVGRSQLPTALQQDPLSPLIQPDPTVIATSEFLLPLSDNAIDQYRRQWTELRQSSLAARQS